MLDRWVENKNETVQKNLLEVVDENGVGCIVFSPLAQGLLTDKYLKGIPADSRVGRQLPNGALTEKGLDEAVLKKIAALNELAKFPISTLSVSGPAMSKFELRFFAFSLP